MREVNSSHPLGGTGTNHFASLLVRGVALAVGLAVIVFATYGTFDGGLVSSGTVYARYAIPAGVMTILALFCWDVGRQRRVSLYALSSLEFALLCVILVLILLGTFRVPDYLLTTVLTAFLAITIVVFVTNRARTSRDFLELFAFYQLLMYVAAALALATGLYSIYVGPFKIGPLLIEYNPYFWRMNSWYVSSTGLGLLLCHGVFGAYYFLRRDGAARWRPLHFVMIAGFVYGMALAGARSAFAVLVIAFATLVVARANLRLVSLLKVAALAGLSVAAAVYLLSEFSEAVFILRRFQAQDVGTLGGRTDFLLLALRDMSAFSLSELLFGVGVNGVRETLGWEISVHSGVLRFLLEYGVLMVVAYGILCVILLLRTVRRVPRVRSLRNEQEVVLLVLTSFVAAELIVIQLFGLSLEFMIFVAALGFHIAIARLTWSERVQVSQETSRIPASHGRLERAAAS
jgi:hypothetical protein